MDFIRTCWVLLFSVQACGGADDVGIIRGSSFAPVAPAPLDPFDIPPFIPAEPQLGDPCDADHPCAEGLWCYPDYPNNYGVCVPAGDDSPYVYCSRFERECTDGSAFWCCPERFGCGDEPQACTTGCPGNAPRCHEAGCCKEGELCHADPSGAHRCGPPPPPNEDGTPVGCRHCDPLGVCIQYETGVACCPAGTFYYKDGTGNEYCLPEGSTICDDGTICPSGTSCVFGEAWWCEPNPIV